METELHCLAPGVRAVVTRVDTEEALTRRLRAFGLVPGTKIVCRYKSPAGDVTALEVRGAVLALRTRDLRHIRGVQE